MTEAEEHVVVLMATFNGAAYVEDQIRSILDQRGVRVRIIVRDDGSTDETRAILAHFHGRYPDLIEIMADGRGPCGSAAANFFALLSGAAVGPNDWIALADQDDIWFPDKLACALVRMIDDQADGYSSNLIAFSDDANTAWQVRKNGAQRPFDYIFQGASAGCTYVLSRRALDVVRAGLHQMPVDVPPYASHDWLIYALCRSANLRWALDSKARIAYRQHAANVYGTKSGIAKVLERARMVRSSWYRNAILWLRTMLETSPAEDQVFSRVERLAWHDRLWLARRAGMFRRDPQDARQLRFALLSGLFR
jgi:rhamnosyltransferase